MSPKKQNKNRKKTVLNKSFVIKTTNTNTRSLIHKPKINKIHYKAYPTIHLFHEEPPLYLTGSELQHMSDHTILGHQDAIPGEDCLVDLELIGHATATVIGGVTFITAIVIIHVIITIVVITTTITLPLHPLIYRQHQL